MNERSISSTSRPVVLLDVDGVVNRFPRVEHLALRPDEFTDFETAKCRGFLITYSPEVGKRLAALDADIYWLTTWEMDGLANTEIAPLFGWEPLPIIPRADHDQRGSWWKSSAAEEFLKENPRPVIWLDDDLNHAERNGEVEWLRDYPHPKLAISPITGLTPEHLGMIEEFCRDHQ